MNTTMIIILIAIAATMIPLIVQFSLRGREMSPTTKRMLWMLTIAGVVLMVITIFVYIT